MPDWKQVLENALDILKYPGDLSDTLAEFQRKWGREVPALFSPRFDEINTQYIRLPHEQGVSALGQELTKLEYALYDLDGENHNRFVLLPAVQREEFEAFCRQQGHYFRLVKQRGREWGLPAKPQNSGAKMPCEEYVLSGQTWYHITSFAGDFASGWFQEKDSPSRRGSCIVDLRQRPPKVISLQQPCHFAALSYSSELDLYAGVSASASGEIGGITVGKNPMEMDRWSHPSPIGYAGRPERVFWLGNHLCVGDEQNATVLTSKEDGRWECKNYILPKGKGRYCFAADGLGRIYITNRQSTHALYRIQHGTIARHWFPIHSYDDLENSIPVPGTSRIWMIRETTGNPLRKNILDLDLETGRCRIANLPGMGENPTLSPFTKDWVLIQSNGEDLKADFAQLWNPKTGEILRIRPGMFGSEKLEHVGVLRDGTVVLTTLRAGVGQVIHYPVDFWSFLRTANKSKKLEHWRHYKEIYPDLPFDLPPKEPEIKAALKKNGLTICGKFLAPPFSLSQMVEALGPARMDLQDQLQLNLETEEETRPPFVCAIWDELGIQGCLDENESEIRILAVCLAPHPKNLSRWEFDGVVQIGGKDYRKAAWEPWGLAQKLQLEQFTVYTCLPGTIPPEMDPAQQDLLSWLSTHLAITWKRPESEKEGA